MHIIPAGLPGGLGCFGGEGSENLHEALPRAQHYRIGQFTMHRIAATFQGIGNQLLNITGFQCNSVHLTFPDILVRSRILLPNEIGVPINFLYASPYLCPMFYTVFASYVKIVINSHFTQFLSKQGFSPKNEATILILITCIYNCLY